MVDENIKQQIIDNVKTKNFFNTKRVARQLNIEPRLVARVYNEMSEEGLIKRWNKRQWTWVKTCGEINTTGRLELVEK